MRIEVVPYIYIFIHTVWCSVVVFVNQWIALTFECRNRLSCHQIGIQKWKTNQNSHRIVWKIYQLIYDFSIKFFNADRWLSAWKTFFMHFHSFSMVTLFNEQANCKKLHRRGWEWELVCCCYAKFLFARPKQLLFT